MVRRRKPIGSIGKCNPFSALARISRRRTRRVASVLALAALFLPGAVVVSAQQEADSPQPGGQQPAEPGPGAVQPTDDPLTFLDSVTVSATLRPAPVRETPGMVSVIDSETIEERLTQNFADLVKYEPGVYVENNVTRLGLNGFNIRGIGGNRVMTQVDGVQTSEQFDFGPFNIHQAGLDVDALKTVEIVRSANSALYGSDALGGVVSLFTKDPSDYLGGRPFHAGAKTTWDGRSDSLGGNLSLAGGTDRLQASLFASAQRGNEIRNKGTVETADDTRTAPNPQSLVGTQVLAKLVFTPSPGNVLRTTAEVYDTRVETEWFSDRGLLDFGSFQFVTADSDAVDTQDRRRISVDHTLVDRGLDQFSWRLYGQFNDTSQVIDRERMTFGFGPPLPSLRHGTLDYEQAGYGGSLQGQQWLGDPDGGILLTAGAAYRNDYFDILRDRTETHAITGAPVPTSLIFPTKYFPESTVTEAGAYLQAELQLGRLTLVPGVRYDHFALDANQDDPVFIASLAPEAADFSDAAVSPKLGVAAQVDGRADRARAVLRRLPGAALQRHQHRLHQSPRRLHDASESEPAGGDQPQLRGRGAHGVRPGEPRPHRVHEPLRRLHREHEPRRQPGHAAARVPEPEPGRGGDQRRRAAGRGVPERQRDGARELRPHRREPRSSRTWPFRPWPRRRRSARSPPTKECSGCATFVRPAAGAASSPCAWWSRTSTAARSSSRRRPTRSSTWWASSRSRTG